MEKGIRKRESISNEKGKCGLKGNGKKDQERNMEK